MSKRKRKWGRWQAEEKHFDEGGQASVYYVTDALGIHSGLYVLKQLKNAKRRERFRREIDSLQQLEPSEHIVQIIDSSSPLDAGTPWYVMPRADGTLNDALSRVQSNMDESLRLFEHVCLGVRHLHSLGFIHRDLKPDNILLFGDVAKVSDFGLAFDKEAPRLTAASEAVGSRFFMAPELEDGRLEDVGTEADVYSLGKVLYFLLTGGVKFAREKHRLPKYSLDVRATDPRAKLFGRLINIAIEEMRLLRFKDAGIMYEEFRLSLDRYRMHPRTQILVRFSSLDRAMTSTGAELQELPASQLSSLLEHATSCSSPPEASLLNASRGRLSEPGVFESICRCLLKWDKQLDPLLVIEMAAAAVVSQPTNVSLLTAVGIDGERRLLELALQDDDSSVLNAVASRSLLGLKQFPAVVERLGDQVQRLAPKARRDFLVASRDMNWPRKEAFLLAHVDACDDIIEFEAAIAGLCRCSTAAALDKVVSVANTALEEPRLGAVIRGIALGASFETRQALGSLPINNRIVVKLLRVFPDANDDTKKTYPRSW